jgi:ATP synthase subunit H
MTLEDKIEHFYCFMDRLRALVGSHPALLVLLVGSLVGVSTKMISARAIEKYNFKSKGNRDQAKLTLYLSVGWAYFAWGIVFLSQAKPMITPK